MMSTIRTVLVVEYAVRASLYELTTILHWYLTKVAGEY